MRRLLLPAAGPGQFTRFHGFLHLPEQRVHFAGEHTSINSAGFMDGAIETGNHTAREVLA
jgi:monoamine oxidase